MSDYVILEIKVMEVEMIFICYYLYVNLELSFEEFNISELVVSKLMEWGYQVMCGFGKIGVVGSLSKGDFLCIIGLCVDMDVLLIEEIIGLFWVSMVSGKMYVCGYDGYIIILLVVVKYIVLLVCQFNGMVYLIFQLVEEVIGGVDLMIKDGLFEQFFCECIFGLYNMSGLFVGKLGFYVGNFMVLVDIVKIMIIGYGGYGVYFECIVDLIVVGVVLVMVLQSIVVCNVLLGEMVVVSVGIFQVGIVFNVILESVVMELSVWVMKQEICDLLIKCIYEFVDFIVKSYGVSSVVEVYDFYLVLINSFEEIDFVWVLVLEVFGCEGVLELVLLMNVSEDFVFMLCECLGSYFLFGNGEKGEKGGCMVYNFGYDFNDDIIIIGVMLFVCLVEKYCC